MTKAMVTYLVAEQLKEVRTGSTSFPDTSSPPTWRRSQRSPGNWGCKIVMFPDTSNVLNRRSDRKILHVSEPGGTTVADLMSTGRAGHDSSRSNRHPAWRPGPWTPSARVHCEILKLAHRPQGHGQVHRHPEAHRRGKRSRLDQPRAGPTGGRHHRHAPSISIHRKVALAGDPDQLVSLTEFLVDLDMWPIHIVTGTPGKKFESKIQEITKDVPHPVNVRAGGDMFLFHQWMKNEPVDLHHGQYLCQVHRPGRGYPFDQVRLPYPRPHRPQLLSHRGLRGGMRLLEKILEALMDRQDRDAPEESVRIGHVSRGGTGSTHDGVIRKGPELKREEANIMEKPDHHILVCVSFRGLGAKGKCIKKNSLQLMNYLKRNCGPGPERHGLQHRLPKALRRGPGSGRLSRGLLVRGM